MRLLWEVGNRQNDASGITYELPAENRETFKRLLHIIYYGQVPELHPAFPELKLDALVRMYGAAQRLRMGLVMNLVFDEIHADATKFCSISWRSISNVYSLTAKGSGLRRWYIDQACLLGSEVYQSFGAFWPVEALVDLAIALRKRSVPPSPITGLANYHELREESGVVAPVAATLVDGTSSS